MPWPPCMPEYQTWARAGTRWRQRLGQHRAAGDEADDRAGVGGGDRLDQRLVGVVEGEALAVAARGEAQGVAARDGALDEHGVVGEPGLEGGHHLRLVGPGEQGPEVGGAAVADELALVGPGVADHDDGEVGARGQGGGRVQVGAVGVDDLGVGEGGPQAVERGDDRRGVDVAGAAVAEVALVGEAPSTATRCTRRVDGAGPGCRRPARSGAARPTWRPPRGPAPGGRRGEHVAARAATASRSGSAAWRSMAATVRVTQASMSASVTSPALEGGRQAVAADHAGRHLDVEPGGDRRARRRAARRSSR